VREFIFRLHPDAVAFWIKGPLWIGLGVFAIFNSLAAWPYIVAMLVIQAGTFASFWVTMTGIHIIKQCPDKYGLSTRPYQVLIWLHWLSAIATLYWAVVIVIFDTPPFHVAGDLGRTAVIAYSVTFMLLWRTRMRGLVSLERKHAAEEEEFSLKWWQWRFFPFGVKLRDVQRRLQAYREIKPVRHKPKISKPG
jgi:hypothetical protein